MGDLRSYDPKCVLSLLPRRGPQIREAIDAWLEDIAPKLPGLGLLVEHYDHGFGLPTISLRMTAPGIATEADITPVLMSDRELIASIIAEHLDVMHRKLIDLARQDPDRFRRIERGIHG